MTGFGDRPSSPNVQALDRALDAQFGSGDPNLADNLFAIVDALDSSPALRRALTNPNAPAAARQHVLRGLLEGKVGEPALQVGVEGVGLRWNGGRILADALEREGVRAVLRGAGDQLDSAEDDLFRFARMVDGTPDLRTALADRTRSVADRQALVTSLLDGKANPAAVRLAQRAVSARERTFALTLQRYVEDAARLRASTIATVRVARELDAEQLERLRAALSRQGGQPITIQQIVDPSVIGGVRVELGGEVIEGSVSGRLDDARRQLGA